MKIHFIAIGGAIMHNLAICLKNMGNIITGSDDIIFDPAKTNLEKYGILPDEIGFFASNINKDMDAVILGMHAKKNNEELLKAQELNIPIYSFPEFIYTQAKDKIRIVVGGSHGKTTTTAMIMHVMKVLNYDFDYLVGSSLEGFDLSVQLSDAPYIVLEGDEYLSSPIEMTSKFHFYNPDVSIITGIAWDHVNVFPTWESYVATFETFLKNMRKESQAILFEEDETISRIAKKASCFLKFYGTPDFEIKDGITYLKDESGQYKLQTFGKHNLQNMEAAKLACKAIGISKRDFYSAISSFKGTAKRLEAIENDSNIIAFRDFAHSPSKLEATLNSVKEQFKDKKLVACMELHTFSSTDKSFLAEYKNSMQNADLAIVYMSSKAFEIKNKAAISNAVIHETFNQLNIHIAREPKELVAILNQHLDPKHVFLMMSSGNFDGLDLKQYFNKK